MISCHQKANGVTTICFLHLMRKSPIVVFIMLMQAIKPKLRSFTLRLYGDNTLKRANIRTAVKLFIDLFSFFVWWYINPVVNYTKH